MADPSGAPHPPVGSFAPSARFAAAAGVPRATADVLAEASGKPTLLVFFKTSCPVCQLDWPYLERLHQAHGAALRVVGVSQDDPEASRRYHAEYGKATFDLLFDPAPAYDASNAFGVESVPHHVLVDPDGTVRKVFAGWSRKEVDGLDRSFAAERGVPPANVVPADDPVPVFKPG